MSLCEVQLWWLGLSPVFWRRGRGLGSSFQVAARLWPWLFWSQLWDLLSRKRWVARVWIRAAVWLHYQMDALYWAALTGMSFPLYCICYYFMSVIPSVSPFSRCSCSLCPSANVPLTTHLSPAPAHLGSSLLLCCCCSLQPFLQLTPSAVASPSFPTCCNCPIQIFGDGICFYANVGCKTNQLSWGGKHLGIVCLGIIRTECKTCRSYTRLETYCI